MKNILNKFVVYAFVFLVVVGLGYSLKTESAGPATFFLSPTPSSVMPDSTVEIDLGLSMAGICSPFLAINNSVTAPEFTDFTCGPAPADWVLSSETSSRCEYTSEIVLNITTETFSFSAKSPDAANATYDFEINTLCAFSSKMLSVNLDNTTLTIDSMSEDPGSTTEEFSFSTNIESSCRYSDSTTVFADMTPMETTGTTSHSHIITGLSEGTAYTYNIRCQDSVGNNSAVSELNFTTTDETGPVISNLVNSLITKVSAMFSFNTNETADCRYKTSDVDFSEMTEMESTSSTGHSQNLSSLESGTDYTYYIKCSDMVNNFSASTSTSFKTKSNSTSGSSVASMAFFQNAFRGAPQNTPTLNKSENENKIQTLKTDLSKVRNNLSQGESGEEVKKLQEFLVTEAKGGEAEKLKLHGLTNYFGPLTKKALAEWQKSMNVYPALGYFGPITKAKILGL